MAVTQTLLSGVGPLPLSNSFVAEGDSEVVIFISGSAFSQTENSPISITLYIDDEAVGTSMAFTNEANSHKTLVPIFVPAKLAGGTHTVSLDVDTGTTTDFNDNFRVTVFY